MEPGLFHFEALAVSKQEHFFQSLEAFRLGTQANRGDLAAIAPGLAQQGHGDPARGRLVHSRISSVNRRFSFIPAAPRIVRMERAVRPCLPITLPRSLAATLSSKTVTCSPSTSLTTPSSEISTRAFAISSINCFIAPPPCTHGNPNQPLRTTRHHW